MARQRSALSRLKASNKGRVGLLLTRDGVKVVSPYNPDFVSLLKTTFKPEARTWNAEDKVWTIAANPENILALISISTKAFGFEPEIFRDDDLPTEQISEAKFVDRTSYYTVLGIKETATSEEVKAAWRVKMLAFHPDKLGRADDTGAFHIINEAYHTLRDEQKRKRYDAARAMVSRRGDKLFSPWR